MHYHTALAVYSVLLAGLGSIPATAQAQELASEGQFSITYVFVNPHPTKAVAVSQDRETANNNIATAVNDAGSGLMHNMAGRCLSINTVDKKANTNARSA